MSSIKQKLFLLAGLLTGTKAWAGPLDVLVDTTGRCNLNCVGCLTHSPLLKGSTGGNRTTTPADIPFSTFTRLCDELSEYGECLVTLAGEGEPLLHPQLIEMLQYAKSCHLKTRINTNGTLITHQKAKELINSGLDELVFSLWAIDSAHAEEVYPGRGKATLGTQMKSLEILREAKQIVASSTPRIILYHPLNHQTMGSLGEIMKLASEYDCDSVHFSPLRTRQGRVSALAPDSEQIKTLKAFCKTGNDKRGKHNLNDVILAYKLGERVWEHAPCYIGWFGFYLDRSGDIRPCKMCKMSLGTLKKTPLKSIWNGQEMRAFRVKSGTRKGLSELLDSCDCEYCCRAITNYEIHHKTRWFMKT
ncbi:MAG: hypothetical protein DRH08_02005 [Deltaproteobacteria bacterium]|nr:MAG: hypothetical protein DRH08_02005 [Deltaproteobacteria bacterium]